MALTRSTKWFQPWPAYRRANWLAIGLVALAAVTPRDLQGRQEPGALDSSFGAFGHVITDVFGNADSVSAIAAYPGGRIIVAGLTRSPGVLTQMDIVLARYLRDGSLDPTFGSGGLVVTDFGAFEGASAVAIQPDGRILVAGTISSAAGQGDFALVRYEGDGSLDMSFGAGGLVTTDFSGTSDAAVDIALVPNGDIVVAGTINWSTTALDTDFGVARYDRDGNLHPWFGAGGKVTIDFGSIHDFASALAVSANGEIVVAGTTTEFLGGGQMDADFALAWLDRDGDLQSRGLNGRVITDFGGSERLSDIALTRGGEIIAAGYNFPAPGGGDFVVARYTRHGTLDASFGAGGRVFTDFAFSEDAAFAVAVHPNGTILVAGRTSGSRVSRSLDFALARYRRDGALDERFGSGGLVVTDFLGRHDEARAVAILPDNRFVAAGQEWDGQTSVDFALAGYQW